MNTRKKIINIIIQNKTFLSACSSNNMHPFEIGMLKTILYEYEKEILSDDRYYTTKVLYRLFRKDLLDCGIAGYII